jgi:hypothetical protein
MFKPSLMTAEWTFILGFGVFHLLVPLFLPPNFLVALIPVYSLFWGLRLADFVIPGCIVLAALSILFVYTKNRFVMGGLMVMYLGGAFFHGLYLVGYLPPLIIVPETSFLAFGILIDTLTAIVIFDYHRRNRVRSGFH